MITRAGVPASKVIVGITSYGRSFKMADPNCWGPTCKYLGTRDDSPAQKGKCTNEGGYLANGEINDIRNSGALTRELYDGGSDSDIMIYNNVEYVGYMNDKTKQRRIKQYKSLNFGGATDWAVDLDGSTDTGDKGNVVYIGPEVYTQHSMGCQAPCTIVLPPSPLPTSGTVTIPPYTTSLQVGTSTTTITIRPPRQTISEVPFYNVIISSGSRAVVQPYPSVTLPPVPVPVSWVSEGVTRTSTRTVILPPWPQVTNGPPENWQETGPPTGTTLTTTAGDIPPPPPPTWTGALPVYTDWYQIPAAIEPVTNRPGGGGDGDDDDDDDEAGFALIPCNFWFFDVSIAPYCLERLATRVSI